MFFASHVLRLKAGHYTILCNHLDGEYHLHFPARLQVPLTYFRIHMTFSFRSPPPWASSYICCVDQFVGPKKIGSKQHVKNWIISPTLEQLSSQTPNLEFFTECFEKCRGVRVSGHMWLPVKTFMRHGVAFGRQATQNVVQKTGRNSELDSKMPGFCSDGRPCQETNPSNHCRNSCWTSTRLGPCSGIPHIPLASHVPVVFQGLATSNIFVDQRYHMNAKFWPCHEAMCFWR